MRKIMLDIRDINEQQGDFTIEAKPFVLTFTEEELKSINVNEHNENYIKNVFIGWIKGLNALAALSEEDVMSVQNLFNESIQAIITRKKNQTDMIMDAIKMANVKLDTDKPKE
jgi:hypothetical protein